MYIPNKKDKKEPKKLEVRDKTGNFSQFILDQFMLENANMGYNARNIKY